MKTQKWHKLVTWYRSLLRTWGRIEGRNDPIDSQKTNELFKSLADAKREWQYARLYFDNVTEPDLIDHAIFYMGATEKKYDYLLKKARENGINIEHYQLG